MARTLVWTWIALFTLAGCTDGGTIVGDDDDTVGDDDDDDTIGDDDDTDLGCNDPEVRTLGWGEEVEWWSTTAGQARDFFVGEWLGEVPWQGTGSEPMVLVVGDPIGEPVLTTYPDAEDAHALDACQPFATFTVPIEVAFPASGAFLAGEASFEISEMTIRWDLYATLTQEDCGHHETCQLSMGAWQDTTAEVPTVMARPTLTLMDMVFTLDGSDYAYLTRHEDEPPPPDDEVDEG